MLGNYILHFPLTDFAVSLLVLAALIDVGQRLLRRDGWNVALDLLLTTGFLGALASVGSGLWLLATSDHPHDEMLTRHHWFAYSALAAATVSVVARLFEGRRPFLSKARTASLIIAAALVSGAGFYGGRMAHPGDAANHHPDDAAADRAHDDRAHPETPSGSASSRMTPANDEGNASPALDAAPAPKKPASSHDRTPHAH